jgi:hypothetical protein
LFDVAPTPIRVEPCPGPLEALEDQVEPELVLVAVVVAGLEDATTSLTGSTATT